MDIALRHRNAAWEGFWLLTLGAAQQATGRLDEALASYQRSATLHRRLGDRSREARAWQGAGQTYRRLGRFAEAADFHRSAAPVHRELGDHWQQALALDGLADALREAGKDVEARRHWEEASELLAAYDDPRARDVRARVMAALDDEITS